jgi:hypothetical protein
MRPNQAHWGALKSEFALDIELEQISDIHYLGKKMHVMRIGCLCNDNPKPFTAKDQAKRFFETGWNPKRLRATSRANDFRSKTSLDLAIFMAKQQKELVEKEREERKKGGDYDGEDDDECEDDDSFPLATSDNEREDDKSLPSTPPVKLESIIEFDMKDAKAKPIQWKSPNGSTQTAARIPYTRTRNSFRKSARQTGAGLNKLPRTCSIG